MARLIPTAHFRITASRRLGLDRCEFDAVLTSGVIGAHELFEVWERGSLWAWVVLRVEEREGTTTLHCLNWVPRDGAFVGETSFTRRMKADERRLYARHLPAT